MNGSAFRNPLNPDIDASLAVMFDISNENTTMVNVMDASVTIVVAGLVALDTSVVNIETNIIYTDSSVSSLDTLTQGHTNSLSTLDSSVDNLDTVKFDKSGGTISGSTTFSDTTTFSAATYFDGSTYYTDVNTIDVSTGYIYLSTGLVDSPPGDLQSGIVVGRGTSDPYAFLYDETDQAFRIGITNLIGGTYSDASMQTVATRENTPTNFGIPRWNSTNYLFETDSSLTFNGVTLTLDGDLDISGIVDSNSFIGNALEIRDLTRIYTSGAIQLINKTTSDWLPFATINSTGSENVFDLSNVGLLTALNGEFSSTTTVTTGGNTLSLVGDSLHFNRPSANYIGAIDSLGWLAFRTGGYDLRYTISADGTHNFQAGNMVTTGSLTATIGTFINNLGANLYLNTNTAAVDACNIPNRR